MVVITGGGSTFTVSEVDCFGKSTEAAVMVTMVSAVTLAGAT